MHRPIHSRFLPSLGVALVLALAMISSPATAADSNASGLPWRSGYYTPSQGNAEQMAAFEEWRGRKSDITLLFMGRDHFNRDYGQWPDGRTLKPGGTLESVTSRGMTVSLAIPLLTTADSGDFAKLARGDLDDAHRAVARRIQEIVGRHPIYLRLGWEATRGYPWSYSGLDGNADPDEYKQAYRRIARIYKEEIPGAKVVWNHLKKHTVPIVDYYPGDDAVDVIGIDPYDNCQGTGCVDSEREWEKFLGSYDPATGMAQGLQGLLDFARSHGKKLSICEWGASNRDFDSKSRTNNAYYVTAMYQFFKDNAEAIEYESYFGAEKHQIHPPAPHLEQVSAAYLAAWHP